MSRALRMLALAGTLLASSEAWAVYACGDQVDTCQCGANNPYPCCDNGGNCTWWAWEAACCNWGVGLPGWGNANQWVGNANANASYSVLSYPVTNAVSCRTLGTYGHVAFVTSVSGPNISVTEENCWGNYGMRAWNYAASFFQGYITRKGQTQCRPGDAPTQGCGNCGTQSRGCATSGKWAGWGACGGQGTCAPGARESQSCGTCGTHERTCGGTCQWGAFPQTCTGPDPDGGTLSCDTGQLGACAAGTLRCVDGGISCSPVTAPSAEQCDQIDNDCNGAVDDSISCGAPAATPDPTPVAANPGAGHPAPPSAAPASEATGSSCAAAGGNPAAPFAALLLCAWFTRRLRKRKKGTGYF